MTPLAERMQSIKPSPTFAAAGRVKVLRAEGRDIIDFTLGEPDFDTPDHIKAAAIAAIQNGETKYTPVDGTAALKKAICEKLKKQNGLDYAPEEISVGSGGKQTIYNALTATVNAGDEVIIPAPYWVSYPDIVLLAGGKPVFVPLSAAGGFKITPEMLRAAITPRTKWVIINSPSNPCGAAYTPAELQALVDELKKHPHVMIMSDDLYEHVVYDDFKFTNVVMLEPALKPRTLVVNGVSKAYAMTGWRLGYGAGPKWLIDAMRNLQSQVTSNPCSISQAAAIAALSGDHTVVRERTHEFQARRDATAKWLNEIPGVACHVPEGSFYLFPSVEKFIGMCTPEGEQLTDDGAVTMYLLDAAGVAVVMGSAFGMPGFVRISYATSLEKLEEGCQRMKTALGALKSANGGKCAA
ncbi:MAG TPA: aspartate transaminase [Rhodospirillaceae bacterium]|nr:aspartate transaminase [Rhodospirillaceae bacterium]